MSAAQGLDTAESQLAAEERRKRSLDAFRRHAPDVARRLDAMATPRSRLTGSVAGGDLNLDLGHTLFYGTDAVSHAEAQLAEFRRQPLRFYMDPPKFYPAPEQHQHFIANALYRHLDGQQIAELPLNPTAEGGFLLIYGIGLGFHLPALFEETEVQNFIVMEEFEEFLYQTLELHDWENIFERAQARGQTLKFFFGSEVRLLADACHWYMRGRGFGLIDGSYIFRHYSSLVLDGAHAQFKKDLPLLPISIGFFEDEIVMLRNCGTNLLRHEHYLLDERRRLEKDVPLFIVGSGPSFDQTVEILRSLKDQAIVMSCGTGLSALLRNGIRPHFHCELENVFGSYEHLRKLAETYGPLDDIVLVGSNTVHPLTPGLFRKRLLIFRDTVSSTVYWAPDKLGLYGMAPTVTNVGVRVGLLLRFREIYLFGVDLGTRDATRHHSNDAIYAHDKQWTKDYGGRLGGMSIPMPANFGGEAWTNEVLHWARMMMIQEIDVFSREYANRIYNCSDGVRIPGTIPKLARTLKFAIPPGRPARVMERVLGEVDAIEPGALVDLADLAQVREEFRQWSADFYALIERTLKTGSEFVVFYREALEFLAHFGARPHQRLIRALYVGTMMMAFQITWFFYRRVSEPEQAPLMAAALAVLRERLESMEETLDAELAGLEALGRDAA